MTAIHYRPNHSNPYTSDPEVIAAFPDVRSASSALRALRGLRVDAEVVPVLSGRAAGVAHRDDTVGWRTINGALFGSVWGLLIAALTINFVAVDPSLMLAFVTTAFGTLGGVAVGGLIAGASAPPHDERDAGRRNPSTEAFVMVSAEDPEVLDTACTRLRDQHALDVHRT